MHNFIAAIVLLLQVQRNPQHHIVDQFRTLLDFQMPRNNIELAHFDFDIAALRVWREFKHVCL